VHQHEDSIGEQEGGGGDRRRADGDALKTQLRTAVTAAQNSPTLLPAVLTRIRQALGG